MESIESFDQLFGLVSEYCKGRMSDMVHSLWIKNIRPVGMDGSTVRLRVSSEFKKNILEERYLPLLREGFADILGFDVDIRVECDDAPGAAPSKGRRPERKKEPEPAGEYEYTFSTFIVGPSNKFAHAASLAVATNPGQSYNPLFIYGASGLGKTHLLNAICSEVGSSGSKSNVLYVKGEEFTNELIDAITRESTKAFHDKYRAVDILLVDDIQFIGGKESTQEEFFHTFNALYQDGRQIVLTSDRPPKEIKTLEERLRTRFEWGLLADIQAPDFETRIAIIRRKAELLDIDIPGDVAEYIANRLKTNIRQLEGTVKKLKAYSTLAGTAPSVIVAQNAIRDILNDNMPVPVTVERIISEVGRNYGVTPQDIRSNKRSSSISTARQISIYVVREITQMSTSSIGDEFGGRDHSTVVYTIQKVDKMMKQDPKLRESVQDIIKNIRDS